MSTAAKQPTGQTDRTWQLPNRRHAMRMRWHDLLFAHWKVQPQQLAPHVPSKLTIDTYNGSAWIAVVPFRMTDVAPRCVPAIRGVSDFPELNVRTYVKIDNKPGVWFFNLEATNKIAVRIARRFFHLRYMDALMSIKRQAGWFQYRSRRTHRNEPAATFIGRYRPISEPFYARPGTLEHWLTARYCLYTCDQKGNLLRGEIDHNPWPLQQAELEIETNTMLDWLTTNLGKPANLLFSRDISVRAWTNKPIHD